MSSQEGKDSVDKGLNNDKRLIGLRKYWASKKKKKRGKPRWVHHKKGKTSASATNVQQKKSTSNIKKEKKEDSKDDDMSDDDEEGDDDEQEVSEEAEETEGDSQDDEEMETKTVTTGKLENLPQGGEQKKILQLMSEQFNSTDISDKPIIPTRRGNRIPRLTRKRKSDVLEEEEKLSESPRTLSLLPPPSQIISPPPTGGSSTASALKKIRKESIEKKETTEKKETVDKKVSSEKKESNEKKEKGETSSPASYSLTVTRKMRSKLERMGRSTLDEKDSSEDTASVSEASEVESKSEEVGSDKDTAKNRKKVRGRKTLSESHTDNDSGTESPIVTKSKKSQSTSDDDQQSEESKSSTLVRSRSRTRGSVETTIIATPSPLSRGKGRGRLLSREDSTESKGKGKAKTSAESSESPSSASSVTTIGRGRPKKGSEDNDNQNNLSTTSAVGQGKGKIGTPGGSQPSSKGSPSLSTNMAGRIQRKKATSEESPSQRSSPLRIISKKSTPDVTLSQPKRIITPPQRDSSPGPDTRRKRPLLSRDSPQDATPPNKKGKQLTIPEFMKKQDTASKSNSSKETKEDQDELSNQSVSMKSETTVKSESEIKLEETKPKPEEPKPKLEEPKLKPEEPKPKPEEPKAKAEEPKAKAEEPKAKPEEPKVKAVESKAKAEEPKAKAEESKAKAEEPKAKPDEAKPKSEESKLKPEESKPKPEEPKPKPEEPKPKLEPPKSKPEVSAVVEADKEPNDNTKSDTVMKTEVTTDSHSKLDHYIYTKTGKKKKKHFRGLRYSFGAKKKKTNVSKTKKAPGASNLDTSQETDSVVSEDVDAESIDSSSQDVPSEQLSQDADALDDLTSDAIDNEGDDAEMENSAKTQDGEDVLDEDSLDDAILDDGGDDFPEDFVDDVSVKDPVEADKEIISREMEVSREGTEGGSGKSPEEEILASKEEEEVLENLETEKIHFRGLEDEHSYAEMKKTNLKLPAPSEDEKPKDEKGDSLETGVREEPPADYSLLDASSEDLELKLDETLEEESIEEGLGEKKEEEEEEEEEIDPGMETVECIDPNKSDQVSESVEREEGTTGGQTEDNVTDAVAQKDEAVQATVHIDDVYEFSENNEEIEKFGSSDGKLFKSQRILPTAAGSHVVSQDSSGNQEVDRNDEFQEHMPAEESGEPLHGNAKEILKGSTTVPSEEMRVASDKAEQEKLDHPERHTQVQIENLVQEAEKKNPVVEAVGIPDADSEIKNLEFDVPVVESKKKDLALQSSATDTPVLESSAEIGTPVFESIPVDISVAESSAADTHVVESASADIPIVESASAYTPVMESSAADTPVVESATADAPVVEAATVDTPVVEAATVDTPVVEAVTVDTPVVEAAILDTPVVESATVDTPVVESETTDTPVVESLAAVSAPIVESSATDIPVVESAPVDTPIVESPAVDIPVVEAPSGPCAMEAAAETNDVEFPAESSVKEVSTKAPISEPEVENTVTEPELAEFTATESDRVLEQIPDEASVKEPQRFNDHNLRVSTRRRQSTNKRRLDDVSVESQNSDSSDSLGETRTTALEGIRKSKRLSRNGSPHPLSVVPPKSPEGAGSGPARPEASQSSNVAAPSLTNVLCKCEVSDTPVAVGFSGDMYCKAVDSFDGRMIGCCNIVTDYRYLRVSTKIPFMLLCNIHRERLRRHNCCPWCGLFCTQGVFNECSWDKSGVRHYYHKLCSLVLANTSLCPHCGSDHPPREVQLELKMNRKPVIYLKQQQERKESSARMTWSKKEEQVAAPDEIPEGEPSFRLKGTVISAHKLPLGLDRQKLQEAIRSINTGKTFSVKPSAKSVYWACKQNDLEKLLHVLVNGVSPNIRVKEYGNQTGLHVAASFNVLAAVHVLILAGATMDMVDLQLMSPLMVAIVKGHNDIVQYLIQAGASLLAKNQEGMTSLHLAAKCGNFVACQYILDSGRLTRHSINTQDEGGWTPLVWASENRFINVVKLLLDRGGNPQLCDVEQNTALHWAAFSGSTQICSMLLDRGCSLRSMNAHGDTPLHIVARQNHTDAVVLFLARGARLDIMNSKQQTPIDCALPDSDVYLQLNLNSKLLNVMKQNNFRTEKILSSDIAAGKEAVPIPCVNGIDDELLPKDYLYIAENCEASNVAIDRTITTLKWCECEDGCNADACGCGQLNFQCWYDPEGRLLSNFSYTDPPMIFECNRACRCNKLSCNNRVVQHGISAHMQLFKTEGKGWGVRALKTIQKGSYVCEYVGEIITDLEADQREDDSYLFDLDNRDSETFCIDARGYGNIARFINHLCEPNLTPVKIFIDHQDLTFPRIAFFANRDIEADEELGFDYGEKFWIIKYKHFTCTCGSEKCKYSSKTIHETLENYNKKTFQSAKS